MSLCMGVRGPLWVGLANPAGGVFLAGGRALFALHPRRKYNVNNGVRAMNACTQ